MKHWRNSASVIILAKNSLTQGCSQIKNDINIFLQKRSSKSRAFPDTLVFPGGVISKYDATKLWIDHFKTFGFEQEHFMKFQKPNSDLHPITLDGDSSINKHISLRITAIRETFEESGILICKSRRDSKTDDLPWSSFIAEFDIPFWQKKVHKDPRAFLNLCQTLDCYPNIWSLHLWSNWLTPLKVLQTPRFNTVFFITAFKNEPLIHIEENEVTSFIWSNCKDVLTSFEDEKVTLAFPQWFELSKLKHQTDLERLIDFASKRSPFGCELYCPSLQPATDGVAALLPGDEFYPKEPDYIKGNEIFSGDKTLEELRNEPKVLHRCEYQDGNTNYYSRNFTTPLHHISLNNGNIPIVPKNIKSSL